MPDPRRILISGYYGLRNTGDEAVLSAIIKGLRAQSDDVEIIVLSQSPEETSVTHGVRALPRMSPSVVTQAIDDCDLFISGGGSLLQDATSFKSLVYYLLVIGLAKRRRPKVMVLGQGIGPLRRGISRALTARTLAHLDLITVRDAQSAELLRELGIRDRIEVTADPTFILDPCPAEESGRLLREAGFGEDEDIIAVSLRKWPETPELESAVSKALSALAEKVPARFLLVTMQTPDDEELARQVAQAIGKPDRFVVQPALWSANQLLGVLSRCRLVVGMRLHALIFAAAAGTPSLGIVYDPKVEQFVKMTGQEGISLGEVSTGLLPDRAVQAWDRREDLASELARTVPPLRDAAMRNFALAAELMSDK
jgi:polysaccharide pyruvyl transferase CsaB